MCSHFSCAKVVNSKSISKFIKTLLIKSKRDSNDDTIGFRNQCCLAHIWLAVQFYLPQGWWKTVSNIVFASCALCEPESKPTDTTVLWFKPKPSLLFQTPRNYRPTEFLLQIINSNKTITRIFRKIVLVPQSLGYTFDCETKLFRTCRNKKEVFACS